MSEHSHSDQKIQTLYDKTKNLKSPIDLDEMILEKIRRLEEDPTLTKSKSAWFYLPIAASVLLAIFLQFKGESAKEGLLKNSIEIAKLPTNNGTVPKQNNAKRNQLPNIFFAPQENISEKIVPACNGVLVEPESITNKLIKPNDSSAAKPSNLPIELIYPNKSGDKSPACDSVSSQIFKK
jgi:hypothetical protein